MDPITAIQTLSSLTSLIKTCRTVIEAIQEFRHGDESLAELIIDVETFLEFLQGLKRVLESRRTKHRISHAVLEKALKDAASTVEKLKLRLERIKETESLIPRRLKWLKSQAEFQKLRGRMKFLNITLYGFLTLAQA
jgi:CII-binding regulator of phage lambda lysogenization HflD